MTKKTYKTHIFLEVQAESEGEALELFEGEILAQMPFTNIDVEELDEEQEKAPQDALSVQNKGVVEKK